MREDTYLKLRRENREVEMQNATDNRPPRIKRGRAKAKRTGWKKLAERISRGARQLRAERDHAKAELERVAAALSGLKMEVESAAEPGG